MLCMFCMDFALNQKSKIQKLLNQKSVEKIFKEKNRAIFENYTKELK